MVYPTAQHRQYISDSRFHFRLKISSQSRPLSNDQKQNRGRSQAQKQVRRSNIRHLRNPGFQIWMRCPKIHQTVIAANATTPPIWRVVPSFCGVWFRLRSYLEFCRKQIWTICPLRKFMGSFAEQKSKVWKCRYLSVEIKLIGPWFFGGNFIQRSLFWKDFASFAKLTEE